MSKQKKRKQTVITEPVPEPVLKVRGTDPIEDGLRPIHEIYLDLVAHSTRWTATAARLSATGARGPQAMDTIYYSSWIANIAADLGDFVNAAKPVTIEPVKVKGAGR